MPAKLDYIQTRDIGSYSRRWGSSLSRILRAARFSLGIVSHEDLNGGGLVAVDIDMMLGVARLNKRDGLFSTPVW